MLIYTGNSLVLRFVKDQFDDYRESTIGGERVSFPFSVSFGRAGIRLADICLIELDSMCMRLVGTCSCIFDADGSA